MDTWSLWVRLDRPRISCCFVYRTENTTKCFHALALNLTFIHSFLCPSTSPIVLQFPLCPAEGSRPHLSGCALEEYPRVLGGICLEPWNCTEGAWVSCFSRDTRVHRSPKVQVRRMAVLGFPSGTPFFSLLGSGRKIFNELGKRRGPPSFTGGCV